MQSNAYFLAKVRFGTAENEPAKNLQEVANFISNFAHFATICKSGPRGRGGVHVVEEEQEPRAREGGLRRRVAQGLLRAA